MKLMTTQVIFKIDKKLKERAMKKAENEGLPFASVLKLATKAYADGELTIGMIPKEAFNLKTRREITAALKDIKKGKHLSRAFSTAREAAKYLERR